MTAEMNRITLHGNELRYADIGTGRPIVFVHGLMSSADTWTAQLERLADRYRVIAPDLLGHGGSARKVQDARGPRSELATPDKGLIGTVPRPVVDPGSLSLAILDSRR